jgi:hypothetical protein
MDLRQFAMMGIPIYDVLNKMGVTGTATAQDIQRAFQLMAGEGGQFFNAMSKGAETLAGKTTNLEGAWKSFQATFAETSGLAKWWKDELDNFTYIINYTTKLMNDSDIIEKANAEIKSGINVHDNQMLLVKKQILDIEEKILEYQKGIDENEKSGELKIWIDLMSKLNQFFINGFEKKIQNIKEVNSELFKMDEILQKYNNEKTTWAEKLNVGAKEYLDLQGLIEENYAKTHEAQVKAIEEEIALWEQRKNALHLSAFDKYGTQIENITDDNKHRISYYKEIGITEDEENKINAIITMLLEQLKKGRGKLKGELALWQKILMDNTGFTLPQMEKMWAGISGEGKSLPVIEQFKQVMDTKGQVYLSLFGNNPENQLQVAQNAADTYRKLYEDMFTVTLDKDGNIITVWKESEEAAQEAEKAWKDAVQVLDNASFDKYLDDLNKAAKLLEGSPADRVRTSITQTLQNNGVSTPETAQIQLALDANAKLFSEEIQAELNLVLKNAHDEAVARLMIERNISDVDAERLLKEKENLNYIKNGADYMKKLNIQLQNTLESIRAGNGGYGEAVGALAGQAGISLIQGTDAEAFVQGMMIGGPAIGVINMFIQSLANVLGGMEGLSMILSPITSLLQGLSPILKALLFPLILVSAGMKILGGILETFFGWLVGDLDDLYDSLTASNDEREKEAELLRKLNDQYAKLLDSIREQEEYYLKKRRELNADWAIESMGVNDMILTPHGNFSTDPNDYIIATKNPSTLGNNVNVPVYVNIVNNSTSTVTAQEQTDPDGARRITVLVDQVVQNGIASGKYDGAFSAKQVRDSGKRVSG